MRRRAIQVETASGLTQRGDAAVMPIFTKADEDRWRRWDCSERPKSAERSLSAEVWPRVLNNLVIATFHSCSRSFVRRPTAQTDHRPGRLLDHATCFPPCGNLGQLILLVQETERESCRVSRLPEGWEGVQEDFDRQNAVVWALRPVLPMVITA